jgi:Cd2+/Zn2+-exporting ATPase
MLALAATVERRSEHPLAQAILNEAKDRNILDRYPAAETVQALAGQGVEGTLHESKITVGSHALFHERQAACAAFHEQILDAEADGQTVMLIGKDAQVLGFVGVTDEPRPSSREALRTLKKAIPNANMVMLTGDSLPVANRIADQIGAIDQVRAGLLPQQKLQAVRDLKDRYGHVAMIGDGVNDAPALVAADVGIAMGGAGTAQAMETADVVLMQDDLAHLSDAVQTSRKAKRVIQQNVAFSLAIKAAVLVLAMGGWAALWMAVVADVGASLAVTLNGMRLLKS